MHMRISLKQNNLLIAAMTILLLSGCALRPMPVEDPQLVASPDSVSVRLAEAADRASRSLETLAAVEQAASPEVDIASIPAAPQELRRTINIDWYGPVEQVARILADRASYNFQSFGNVPPTPIVVTITSRNRQVIDVLRDVGLQLGSMAQLKVDAQRRVVELYYPSALDDPAMTAKTGG